MSDERGHSQDVGSAQAEMRSITCREGDDRVRDLVTLQAERERLANQVMRLWGACDAARHDLVRWLQVSRQQGAPSPELLHETEQTVARLYDALTKA